jgi:hypothetical protein
VPWICFSKNFDWSPAKFSGRVTVSFVAGDKKLVTRECAAEAISKGVAHECEGGKAG